MDGVNDYKSFFQVLSPVPSQKPLLTGRTSPKAVRTFSENRAVGRKPGLKTFLPGVAQALYVMLHVSLSWCEKPLSLESKIKTLLLFEVSVSSVRKLKPTKLRNPES